MGLPERRKIKELQDITLPERSREIEHEQTFRWRNAES